MGDGGLSWWLLLEAATGAVWDPGGLSPLHYEPPPSPTVSLTPPLAAAKQNSRGQLTGASRRRPPSQPGPCTCPRGLWRSGKAGHEGSVGARQPSWPWYSGASPLATFLCVSSPLDTTSTPSVSSWPPFKLKPVCMQTRGGCVL